MFAVEIGPALVFSAPATLQVPVLDPQIAANTDIVAARYDLATQTWMAIAPARVSADGKIMLASVEATGQFAFLVADDATVKAGLTPGRRCRAAPR